MAVYDVTQEDFNNKTKEGLQIIDLWAPWCGTCRMLMPVVESVGAENEDTVDILKVNVDEEQELATELEAMSLPTLLIYKDGEKVDNISGYVPKEAIEELIEKHK